MGVKERKERERDQRRELILNAANEIMQQEGLDNISIRKIATRIEYSPAVIYHYFQDKDDIINQLMKNGYEKIVSGLSSVLDASDKPEEMLKKLTRKYIEVALQMPDEYKAAQLCSSPEILEYTSSLFPGASEKKPALKILLQCLKEIYKGQPIDDNSLELTAQVIASSTFGLITRLVFERDLVSEEQKKKLIDHFIKYVVEGMVMGEPLCELLKDDTGR